MDYKEKYDKAIEALRSLFAEQAIKHCDRVNIKDITNIFPELKESEDEKIRKAIYNCVKWFGFDSCFFKDVSQEECLAWLEKQGEQKPVYNGKHKLLTVERAKEMSPFMRSGFEHNPAETEKGTKGNEMEIPNSAWSEEDEQTFIKSVEALEDFGKFDLADWLKEHKDQFLKPQNAWKPSDEQIEALESATENCAYSEYQDYLRELIDQLKKLKE